MANGISRRDFLKISGAATASMVVLSGCTVDLQQPVTMEMYANAPEYTLPGEDFWFASTCRMCPAACGLLCRVSNGRARKLEGNPEHPLNSGKLCARGQAGLQLLYHPDRLHQILVRTGKRGEGQWGTTSWEQIVTDLASSLQAADPGRVAFLMGLAPQYQIELANRFQKGLGADPAVIYDTQSAFDGRAALVAANESLFGDASLPVFDIAHADMVFGFGADFLETWLSPVAYAKAYGAMRSRVQGRGAFVAFAPRLSQTAASADRWLPVAPGAEGLVALALGKIIVDEGLSHAGSPLPNPALYEGVDIAAIAQRSGIDAETLIHLARTFTDAHHPLALPGGLLAGYSNGLDAIKAVEALNVVVGNDPNHGGMYLTPAAPGRDLRQPPVNSLADVEELVQRMHAGEIDMLFIVDANPLYELPAAFDFVGALSKVDQVVAFASLPTETTAQADIILPAHTYLETWGYQFAQPSLDKLIVSAQQPVVQPLYDTRDPGDVFMALAGQIGGSVARKLPWPNMINFIQTRLTSLQLLEGNINSENSDVFWSSWLQHGGWWSHETARTAPQPGPAFEAALTVAEPAFEGNGGDYPFYLTPTPSIAFGDGRHAGLPWLQETPDPMTTASWDTWVEINPETAKGLGIEQDDIVRVSSPAGEVDAIAYLYPGIRPDTVAMPVGQGHSELGRWAAGRGANVLALLAPNMDPTTGQWFWAGTRVKLAPTGQKRPLPVLESNLGVDRARQNDHIPG